MAASQDSTAAAKALYAMAGLVRNSAQGQALFHEAGGLQILGGILAERCNVKVQQKAVTLALDLAQQDAVAQVSDLSTDIYLSRACCRQ